MFGSIFGRKKRKQEEEQKAMEEEEEQARIVESLEKEVELVFWSSRILRFWGL